MPKNYSSLLWRIDKKFSTRKAFCDAIGISANTLSNYVNGHTGMTVSFIEKACEVLSIPKEEIGFYFFTCDEDLSTK